MMKYFGARYLKEALLTLCVLTALPAIVSRISDIAGLISQASYIGLLGALWAALLAAAYIPGTIPRWITAILFAGTAYFMTVFEGVTSEFMTYDAFINMMNSAAFVGDALAQNRVAFIGAAPSVVLLLLSIGVRPRRRLPVPGWLPLMAPWVATAMLTALLFLRGGDGARGQPPSFTPIAYLALAGYESATGHTGPRQPVHLRRDGPPLRRSIVLIVDESIAGQYLDINSPYGVPTPLSAASPAIAIYNYGLAASVTNCSVGTNVTLRYGGTRGDYQRINATQPSIWAYAHNAGLRTVYIDSQRTGGALQNLMTAEERKQIDSFVQFDDVPVEQRDAAAAKRLIRELADPRPAFIYINKVGAHFPVQDKFPDAFLHYLPVLPRGHFRNISDTGDRRGFSGDAADWALYRNSYRDTVLWNVGGFFRTLINEADLSHATMIYTSDHGQNLHERGDPGLFTHCSGDPVQEEGVVPLVVLDGKDGSQRDWSRDLTHNRNRSSHYMIFPTLLELMGYDADAVKKLYGQALDTPSRDPVSFNTLFNARLNRQPRWLVIDPARVIQPPLSALRPGPAGAVRKP
jgi:glucan phosphoethanolaminetransferase (alkaline phosphatase superfamily)